MTRKIARVVIIVIHLKVIAKGTKQRVGIREAISAEKERKANNHE
jgi:hypothetical protein